MNGRLVFSNCGLAALLAAVAAPSRVASQVIEDAKPDPLLLLLQKNVQDDLRLSPEQKARLKASEEKTQAGVKKVFEDLEKGGTAAKAQQEINRINEAANNVLKDVRKTLSREQHKRFKQIELQYAGLDAFEAPEVQKELGLLDKQKERIHSVRQDLEQKVKRIVSGGGSPESLIEQLNPVRKDSMQRAISVLTEEQKKKWQEMTGPLLELNEGPKIIP